jgi:hypothetical protein
MSYNITSYTATTLDLKMIFDHPGEVSSMPDADQVEVKFVEN